MKNLLFGLIATVLFSCSSIAQIETGRGGPESSGHSVRGFLLSADHGCYTILVNVYGTINGTLTIIASSTVCIGECAKFSPTNNNGICKDFELKGDSFYSTKYNYDNCLEDLMKEESIYNEYLVEKDNIINSTKNNITK